MDSLPPRAPLSNGNGNGNDNDGDLDLQPMRGRGVRNAVIGLALVAAAGAVAYGVNARFATERRATGLARASNALAMLERCLVGVRPETGNHERASSVARRTWLARARVLTVLAPAEQIREWPYRCATHASVATHALFEARSDERTHQLLSVLVSRAASALERGELHTGDEDRQSYIDEMLEAARRSRLPTPAVASGPLPPEPPEWRPLTTRTLRPIFRSPEPATVLGADPIAHHALRVLLEGNGPRELCSFGNELRDVSCRPLAYAPRPTEISLLASDDGSPALVHTRGEAGAPWMVHIEGAPGDSSPAQESNGGAFAQGPSGVRVLRPAPGSAGAWAIFETDPAPAAPGASAAPAPSASGSASAPHSTPLAPPPAGATFGPWMFGELVLAAAGSGSAVAPSTDAGSTPSADATAQTDAGGPASAATLFAIAPGEPDARWAPVGETPAITHGSQLTGCRLARGDLALAVRVLPPPPAAPGAPAPPPAVDGEALVALYTNDRWTAHRTPVPPNAALACGDDAITFAWWDARTREARHTRCAVSGCTARHYPVPDAEDTPVVLPLGENVLLAEAPSGGRGVRVRVAPVERLADAGDFTVVEDAQHHGVGVTRLAYGFVRAGAAVLLVTDGASPHATYAVRVDGPDSFAAVQPGGR